MKTKIELNYLAEQMQKNGVLESLVVKAVENKLEKRSSLGMNEKMRTEQHSDAVILGRFFAVVFEDGVMLNNHVGNWFVKMNA